ncbi:MAG: helix-turn-helix domain-containing protein [Stackebrandtia sp.]
MRSMTLQPRIRRASGPVHRYGGRAASRLERRWPGLEFEHVTWELDDDTEGITCRPEHQVIVTLSGATGRTSALLEGQTRYDGADFPGAVTFVPSMRRRWASYRKGVITYAAFRFDPVEALRAAGLDDVDRLEFVGFTNRRDPLIRQLALSLGEEARRPGAAGPLFADRVVATLTLHLVRRYSNLGAPEPAAPGAELPRAKLRRVVDYIHEHLGEELRLPTLAGLVGLDQHRFSRGFKAATGLPPHRYVVERRLERAAELLRTSRETQIGQIAYAVGFSSQSHLTTAFGRKFGVTPRAYREENARLRLRPDPRVSFGSGRTASQPPTTGAGPAPCRRSCRGTRARS